MLDKDVVGACQVLFKKDDMHFGGDWYASVTEALPHCKAINLLESCAGDLDRWGANVGTVEYAETVDRAALVLAKKQVAIHGNGAPLYVADWGTLCVTTQQMTIYR